MSQGIDVSLKGVQGVFRVAGVEVAPPFEHVGDRGENAVEVGLRTWVRGARTRGDLGLELGR